MTVKRWSRGPASSQIGKPAVHPATVDLKGKAYEYVYLTMFNLCSSIFHFIPRNALACLDRDISCIVGLATCLISVNLDRS